MLNIFPLVPSGYYVLLRVMPYFLLSLLFDAGAYYLHPLILLAQLPLIPLTAWYIVYYSGKIYLLTPDFFMTCQGHLYKRLTWLEMYNIKDFRIHQTKIMRHLGVADITFLSGPDLDVTLHFKGIDEKMAKTAITELSEVLKVRSEFYEKLVQTIITRHD